MEMFGDQKWRSTQVKQGGNDTVATELYPEHLKDNATFAKPRKEVTWKESTSQRFIFVERFNFVEDVTLLERKTRSAQLSFYKLEAKLLAGTRLARQT